MKRKRTDRTGPDQTTAPLNFPPPNRFPALTLKSDFSRQSLAGLFACLPASLVFRGENAAPRNSNRPPASSGSISINTRGACCCCYREAPPISPRAPLLLLLLLRLLLLLVKVSAGYVSLKHSTQYTRDSHPFQPCHRPSVSCPTRRLRASCTKVRNCLLYVCACILRSEKATEYRYSGCEVRRALNYLPYLPYLGKVGRYLFGRCWPRHANVPFPCHCPLIANAHCYTPICTPS